jgi:hypothetical protein
VHFCVLLLDLASTVFKVILRAPRAFQLSLDFVEPLILRSPLPSELFKLGLLIAELFLQLFRVERSLRLSKVVLALEFLHGADVLVKVAVVDRLDFRDDFVSCFQLLRQLGDFCVA